MALDGTYAGLQASVAAFLHRADLTARIPDHVVLAEAEMNRTITARRMIGRATASLSGEFFALPVDFAGLRAFRLLDGTKSTLVYVSPEEMADWKDRSPVAGEPRYYTIVGGELELFPVPGGACTAMISYYRAIPPLASNGANWVLSAYPDAYLAGTLKYAHIDLRDDERAAEADALFQRAMAAINAQSLTEDLPGALTPAAGLIV